MIDFKKLISAGVHFGHQTSRWLPKMRQYIWGARNGIHLIDVSKTAHQLEKSAQFLREVAAEGKQILLVGTKKPARDVIKSVADAVSMPYVNHRWVGGTLSNFSQVKKLITRLLHHEDVLAKSEKYPYYTKKELSKVKKNVERLNTVIGGIRTLAWPVGAIVIVDVIKESSALKEAMTMGVPVVALVDTNSDPSGINYVIPANDDAPQSIAVLLGYLQEAVVQGKQQFSAKKIEKAEAEKAAQEMKMITAKEEAREAALEIASGYEGEVVEEEPSQEKRESKTKRVRTLAKSFKQETHDEAGESQKSSKKPTKEKVR